MIIDYDEMLEERNEIMEEVGELTADLDDLIKKAE